MELVSPRLVERVEIKVKVKQRWREKERSLLRLVSASFFMEMEGLKMSRKNRIAASEIERDFVSSRADIWLI